MKKVLDGIGPKSQDVMSVRVLTYNHRVHHTPLMEILFFRNESSKRIES